MKNILIVLFVAVYCLDTFCQQVKYCDLKSEFTTLYWYGHEFSMFTMIEPDLVSKAGEIKYSFPYYTNKFELTFPLSRMKKFLKYQNIVDKTVLTSTSFQKIDQNKFILNELQMLEKSKIIEIINSYKSGEAGVGLIVIWEYFNKIAISTSGYFVFFNNITGEILNFERREDFFRIGINGHGWGTKNHIWTRFNRTFSRFYVDYLEETKKCK